MKSRLEIDGISVGYNQLLPISTNYAIADIYEPDKRDSSYTKSIRIPGTKEVNQIFENAFEVNVVTSSFNPSVKIPSKYYVNEVVIFDGSIRLMSVLRNQDHVMYDCQLIGNSANIFMEIYNKLLTDIDFSDLDHAFAYSQQKVDPFYTSPAQKYFYPNIDYGFGRYGYTGIGGTPASLVWFHDLKPAIFEREYLRRIFSDAGYTWTSDFLDSSYYSKIFIPCVRQNKLQLSQSDLTNNQIYVGRIADASSSGSSGTYSSGHWNYAHSFTVPLNNDSSGVYNDPGNNFNTSTYIFTQAISGYYTFYAEMPYSLTITPPTGTVTMSGTSNVNLIIQRSVDGGVTWVNYLSNTNTQSVTSITFSTSFSVNIPGTLFTSGTQWRVKATSSIVMTFYNSGGLPVISGVSSAGLVAKSGSLLVALLASSDLQYNNTVVMNDTVPEEVRQIDFITSIIKCENLYMDLNKDIQKDYIIEPREDFIDITNAIDWTKKQDLSQTVEIRPMGDLDARTYYWKYKTDSDYFNKLYQNEFKEPYGTQRVDVVNDFNTSDKTIEVIFSATPTVNGEDGNIITAPRFYDYDSNNTKSNIKVNIRRLYYGNTNTNFQIMYYNGSSNTATGAVNYFCGHVDDPTTPTIDLCFGTPRKIFWALPGQSYTNNNRYNVRYKKFIEEITDRDSKVVITYVYLNEIDIKKFDFSKLVLIDGTYYIVNKIEDYDPQFEKPCKVTLLKRKLGRVHVPESQVLVGLGGNYVPNGGSRFSYSANYGINSFGTNNINYSQDTFVFGDGNTVSP
jgi:hypothetical protein